MTTKKIEAPTPQRISVPKGTVLQIYSRDADGNKMLMSLPGPMDISMVPVERVASDAVQRNCRVQ
jgi:hypothetical protein